jgi:hypothetical protein
MVETMSPSEDDKKPGEERGRKRGKFSIEELNYMNTNMYALSVEEMALALNRTVEVVQKHVETLLNDKNETLNRLENKEIFRDLKLKPFWAELKQQYTERELELYLYHWAKFYGQFGDDVTHSEEMEICHAIDLQILMHRNLKDKYKTDEEIARLEKVLKQALIKNDDLEETEALEPADRAKALKQNQEYVAVIMTQIQGIRSAQTTKTKEFNDLLTKFQGMSRDLKTTRDQRFKDIQDRKITFAGLLKQFTDGQEKQRMSTEAELISLSTKQAIKDLGEYHTYIDGSIDQPILNSDTVKEDHNG